MYEMQRYLDNIDTEIQTNLDTLNELESKVQEKLEQLKKNKAKKQRTLDCTHWLLRCCRIGVNPCEYQNVIICAPFEQLKQHAEWIEKYLRLNVINISMIETMDEDEDDKEEEEEVSFTLADIFI